MLDAPLGKIEVAPRNVTQSPLSHLYVTPSGAPVSPTAEPAGAGAPSRWAAGGTAPTASQPPTVSWPAAPLRLVIERQDGEGLWGYEEFEDGGETIRVPLTGTVDADGRGLGLSGTGLNLDGELRDADT